jgi:hypothetical protein
LVVARVARRRRQRTHPEHDEKVANDHGLGAGDHLGLCHKLGKLFAREALGVFLEGGRGGARAGKKRLSERWRDYYNGESTVQSTLYTGLIVSAFVSVSKGDCAARAVERGKGRSESGRERKRAECDNKGI